MSVENLEKNIAFLEKQIFWLDLSISECQEIGIKKEYTTDEFGRFETLCSRFARSIDFLVRKVWRSIDDYEFEQQGTLIDVVNNAHKRDLFDDIQEVRMIKEIRNDIVHEYIDDGLLDVLEDVLSFSEKLIFIMRTTLKYTYELK